MFKPFKKGTKVLVKESCNRSLKGKKAIIMDYDGDYLLKFDKKFKDLHDNGGIFKEKHYWWIGKRSVELIKKNK